jgi:hypothetical protein
MTDKEPIIIKDVWYELKDLADVAIKEYEEVLNGEYKKD